MVRWRKDSVKEISEARAAAEKDAALNEQARTAAMALAATSTSITDAQALNMPDMFQTWESVLAAGVELAADRIISKDGNLYRVVQAVTPQENQPPGGDGMLAVYRPINNEQSGAADDPIPWVYGMDCRAGQYFSYNGHVYQVATGGDMTPCVWEPGTPGLWQWVLVE